MNYQLEPSKLDLKPKRHHGYAVMLFIMGTLFPPMAVAARFGFGRDFWLNLLLTICGYIPGHGHNFYIQNIRNNKNHRRTPKWAQRYGLVDTSAIKRKEKKSQWAFRYKDRLPHSALEGQQYEEGEVAGPSREDSIINEPGTSTRRQDGLWRDGDEQYYNANGDRGSTKSSTNESGRWRYPANFEDTLPPIDDGSSGKKKKKKKKDRWARTEDAYSMQGDDLPGASERRKRKKKKEKSSKNRSTVGGADADSFDRRSDSISTVDVPEDPEAAAYADLRREKEREKNGDPGEVPSSFERQGRDVLDHQF